MKNTKKKDKKEIGTSSMWLQLATEALFEYLLNRRLSSWPQALAIAGKEKFGLTYAQIAEVVGVNREVVYVNHQNALKNIKDPIKVEKQLELDENLLSSSADL